MAHGQVGAQVTCSSVLPVGHGSSTGVANPAKRDPALTSKIMSRIRSKDTQPELILASALEARTIPFIRNDKELTGTPDFVMKTAKLVVFVDGDFWHGRDWTHAKQKLKTNREFWVQKIERNMARDIEVTSALREQGWNVLRFWATDVRKHTNKVAGFIHGVYKQRVKKNENNE